MEILITTILILIYLIYKDFSHQKQVMRILNLLTQGKEEPPVTLNPFKEIFKNKKVKKEQKRLEEEQEKYMPLEDVPDEEVREQFEGSQKVDKEDEL